MGLYGRGVQQRPIGDGTTTQRNNPVQVKHADGSGLSGVVGVSAGSSHTVYLKSDGTVWGLAIIIEANWGTHDHA